MRESLGTLNGSRCLVVGYGRIGKVLSNMLAGLGAKVTVAARRPSDLSWISLHGYQCLDIHKMEGNTDFDFVFNTVPALIFYRKLLSKLSTDCLCIELASTPGGFDFDAAEKLGISVIKERRHCQERWHPKQLVKLLRIQFTTCWRSERCE